MSGGGGRRSRTSSFILLPRQQEIESAADTAYYGFVVLGATWIVFVVGMGSALGIWEWAWDVPDSPFLKIANESDDDKEVLIPGYYPALVILTCVMAWVWVVVAWMGMKYFKHAKIQGGGDDG
ncbi:unnamed protein product [Tuber melanosporum]|uniref:(Perigord truffle) hypothetical protein n=1 Tax=Tuber melanosporum (strain Mel28) TaxID=656061 RepID=D5GLG4_TUBMM|nr:uncharacterized protein GSTUM_00010182001 [Tuber melanosporum]CAZ85357.1 unnamed protein product [Tuber melanosporum]